MSPKTNGARWPGCSTELSSPLGMASDIGIQGSDGNEWVILSTLTAVAVFLIPMQLLRFRYEFSRRGCGRHEHDHRDRGRHGHDHRDRARHLRDHDERDL